MTRRLPADGAIISRGLPAICLALVLLLPGISLAQVTAPPDELLDHLSENWIVAGNVMGHPAHHQVDAEWVLNHQFLRIHEKTADDAPTSERRYEAFWFLGYDAVSERYVMHLIDVFGPRFSETLGYGVRSGNEIRFTFEYPDGPFHNTYLRSPEKNAWEWRLEQKNSKGVWMPFADLTLTRRERQ
jgi:hypothetical protein